MRYTDLDAEIAGHVRIHCHLCGYRGWSEDTGGCPNGCGTREPEEEDDRLFEDAMRDFGKRKAKGF